jgi:hypothetical protein
VSFAPLVEFSDAIVVTNRLLEMNKSKKLTIFSTTFIALIFCFSIMFREFKIDLLVLPYLRKLEPIKCLTDILSRGLDAATDE